MLCWPTTLLLVKWATRVCFAGEERFFSGPQGFRLLRFCTGGYCLAPERSKTCHTVPKHQEKILDAFAWSPGACQYLITPQPPQSDLKQQ